LHQFTFGVNFFFIFLSRSFSAVVSSAMHVSVRDMAFSRAFFAAVNSLTRSGKIVRTGKKSTLF
ncbi:hypothetical protein LJC48_00960, partial [Desulfovibrio sp. OttesenSCG-928-C06]|nr:hypothetical protein [Desulfovibrio sp. OttesenSCG-928-C06]